MWRLSRRSALKAQFGCFSTAVPGPCIVHKRGADILHDPWFNKDTGFPLTERDRLGLRGLLPPRVISFEQQYDRFILSFRSLEHNTRGELDDVTSLAKWRILNRLHDRNETLYYRVLIDNIQDFAPIIYTPTVGLVCQNYGGLFRRPRGMYFSAKDKGEMMSMIYNWPSEQVDMIVITDGSRILGLGDLGVQGIGIPIGKLDIYVAAAGINPQRPRLEGEEYLSIVDEFMEAMSARWPKAVIQFEDFQMKWAFETLQRYRKRFCMFNDDIQGTAGVALAGLLGALRAQGRPLSDFVKQKIVVVGAGSAGIGVLNMAKQAISKMVRDGEKDEVGNHNPFWLLDKDVSECTAAEAFKYAGENIVFASGSPFENVDLGDGKVGHVNQANNMYLFPGIRHITAEVGAAVVQAAVAEELAQGYRDMDPNELRQMTQVL
ncbi:unnamed protein product [Victoria cruziana]